MKDLESIKLQIDCRELFKQEFPGHYQLDGNSFCPWHNNTKTGSLALHPGYVFCHGNCDVSSDQERKHDCVDIVCHSRQCSTGEAVKILREMVDGTVPTRNGAALAQPPIEKPRKRFDSLDAALDYCKPVAVYRYQNADGSLNWAELKVTTKSGKMCLPLHEEPDGLWYLDLKNVKRTLFGLPELLAADPDEWVIFAEGPKDAQTGQRLGFVAVTTGSSGSLKRAHEDRAFEPLRGRSVAVFADRDDAGSKMEQTAREILPGIVEELRIVQLPNPNRIQGFDISDYVATVGEEHAAGLLQELIDDTTPYESPKTPQDEGQKKCGPVFQVGRNFRPMPIIRHILSNHHIISINGDLYQWTAETGFYKPWPRGHLTRLYCDLIGDKARAYHVREIRELLIDHVARESEEIDPHSVLCLKNGIFNYETGEITAHTPDLILTSQFPVKFDPEATCPQYNDYLRKALPDPKQRDLAHELLGYVLQKDARFQTAVLFFDNGQGCTGKSTLTEVFQRLLGRGKFTCIPLQSIADKFKVAELAGVHANFSTEVNVKEYIDDSITKQLVSAEEITVEYKHKRPFTFRPFCKLIITANKFPLTHDHSDAFFRRWQVLVFNHQFPKPGTQGNKPRFGQMLPPEEISGVLNHAVLGMTRLKDNEGFTLPESSVEALNKYRLTADPVRDFASQFLHREHGSRSLTMKTVHERYKEWCGEEECQPLSYRKFKDELPRVLKVKAAICNIRNQLIVPGMALSVKAQRSAA